MAKGKQVEALTRRAVARGRARSGPWEVTSTPDMTVVDLYHYGHRVARAADGFVSARERAGHGLSVSDADGIRGFSRGVGFPAPPMKVNRRAYAQGERYPMRGGPEAAETIRDAVERGDMMRAGQYPLTVAGDGKTPIPYASPVRPHSAPHSDPSHHVGPCDGPCRRGQRIHYHRVRRST